ncbi:MAG: FAD-dependent oxidoreductase, partial [Mailhella sp.]|nr:FAD-dependent oxidoreductase [Mailhella sp.]
MQPYDAAIIGAGPAGLLCARNAARRGLRIALIDAHREPGAKLAVAGGGKGNFTNRILDEQRYTGGDTSVIRPLLGKFGCSEVLTLLRELSLPWEERDFGQIFGTRPAYVMAERLAVQADDAGVDFYLGCRASHITRPAASAAAHSFGRGAGKAFFTLNAGADRIEARNLVIASGSPAAPQLGADGSLLDMAAGWGHATVPFRPVLVPLTMQPGWPLAGLEGISLNVRMGIRRRDGSVFHPDPSGIRSLLFTHRGISGPAALVASCFLAPGDAVLIDFLPENPVQELLAQKDAGRLLVRSVLS